MASRKDISQADLMALFHRLDTQYYYKAIEEDRRNFEPVRRDINFDDGKQAVRNLSRKVRKGMHHPENE